MAGEGDCREVGRPLFSEAEGTAAGAKSPPLFLRGGGAAVWARP